MTIEDLTESSCLQLLGTERVGRIALTRHALPVVLPVGYALDGRSIVVRTTPDSVLAGSRDDMVVAFEAGELDPDSGSGWSVQVTGTMQKIIPSWAIQRAQQLRPAAWARDDGHVFVRISPGLVSGSRVEHQAEHLVVRPAVA